MIFELSVINSTGQTPKNAFTLFMRFEVAETYPRPSYFFLLFIIIIKISALLATKTFAELNSKNYNNFIKLFFFRNLGTSSRVSALASGQIAISKRCFAAFLSASS